MGFAHEQIADGAKRMPRISRRPHKHRLRAQLRAQVHIKHTLVGALGEPQCHEYRTRPVQRLGRTFGKLQDPATPRAREATCCGSSAHIGNAQRPSVQDGHANAVTRMGSLNNGFTRSQLHLRLAKLIDAPYGLAWPSVARVYKRRKTE